MPDATLTRSTTTGNSSSPVIKPLLGFSRDPACSGGQPVRSENNIVTFNQRSTGLAAEIMGPFY